MSAPMVQDGMRLLFSAAFGFVFLSSATAESLGLGALRVVAFATLIAAMAVVAVLAAPGLARHGREHAIACAALFLLLLPFQIAGPTEILDWKILLVLLVLLTGPELARALSPPDVVELTTRLLGLYVVLSGLYLCTGEPSLFARGHDGIDRWDVTGSLVTHASLCVLYLVLAGERLLVCRSLGARAWFATTGAVALVMLFLSGTRTTLLVLILLFAFHLITLPRSSRSLRSWLPVVLALPLFAFFTLFVSDTLWLRLVGANGDFTSGRGHSLPWWIGRALDHPTGLGVGAVRRMFGTERPAIEGGQLLEWPHNELVRFWVEGGWLGLLFVSLLVFGLFARTLHFARRSPCPRARLLALAVIADLLAQSLLQNYFNNIYHATVMTAILAVLLSQPQVGAGDRDRGPKAPPGLAAAAQPA
jgi:hypothetical protein